MMIRGFEVLVCVLVMAFARQARGDCGRPELANQKQDGATIQNLENAWSRAYLTGDTAFEACLLAPDFMEIRSDGKINHLDDELALAAKHKGQNSKMPDLPAPTVHMHGDVAVAYGTSPVKMVDDKPHQSYFADYYVWKDGSWHVYFAQQTLFAVPAETPGQ